MIDVKDIRAITEAARNKHLITAIEEVIKKAATQGTNYTTLNIQANRDLTMSIADYFRSAGFIVDYENAGIDPVTGVAIYTIKIWW